MTTRVDRGLDRGQCFTFRFAGDEVRAYPGETVAAALLAHGVRVFRRTARREQPRGLYCAMGVCWECLVTVDGVASQRACMTEAAPGMVIEPQQGVGR